MKFPLPLRAPPLKGMLRDRNDYLTLSVIARPAFIVGRGNLIFQDSGGALAAILMLPYGRDFHFALRAPPLKGMLRDRNDYLTLSVIARPAFIVGRGNLIRC
jgi:hypothetical protein